MGVSTLLTAQLSFFRDLLLEQQFVRRLQRTVGSNTLSKNDVVGFLVKTPSFLCTAILRDMEH